MRRIEISLPTGYNQMCNRFPSVSVFQRQASRMSDNGRKEVAPMPKITDEQYRYLSRAVYFVGKFPNQYRKGRMVTIHGRKYVVEDVESNEKNGLQALAVTPKDALDELVIAYGGTDPADIRDALTDIEFIALGREHRPLEDGRDRLREVIAENPRVQELISRLGLDGTALLAARDPATPRPFLR